MPTPVDYQSSSATPTATPLIRHAQPPMPPGSASVDPKDIARFSALAAEWWSLTGPFRPLHRLNPTRLAFIRETLGSHFGRDARDLSPLSGLTLVDIGCGGGLVAEPMARLGATVTGVDASERNILVAATHAAEQGLTIDYRAGTAEAMALEDRRYDIVLALEVIEHTADPSAFLAGCRALLKPGGIMILSTLNRTTKSYTLGILGAEYIMRWLPRGTHDWRRFLRPSELGRELANVGLDLTMLKGMVYAPIRHTWSMSDTDLDVNYFAVATYPPEV